MDVCWLHPGHHLSVMERYSQGIQTCPVSLWLCLTFFCFVRFLSSHAWLYSGHTNIIILLLLWVVERALWGTPEPCHHVLSKRGRVWRHPHIPGRGCWCGQEAHLWQGSRAEWDLPSDAEGSGHCWGILVGHASSVSHAGWVQYLMCGRPGWWFPSSRRSEGVPQLLQHYTAQPPW